MAVSTACPQLDNIVVENTEVAQQCVKLLHDRKLGVATFLMLDKQAHLAAQAAQPVQPPEGENCCNASSQWHASAGLH